MSLFLLTIFPFPSTQIKSITDVGAYVDLFLFQLIQLKLVRTTAWFAKKRKETRGKHSEIYVDITQRKV